MSSTNQSPEYKEAVGRYLQATSDKEKLEALKEMMKECPKHKSSEKMLANLKTRYIKLEQKLEKGKNLKKSSHQRGIKKEELQAVIIGKTNTGKSSFMNNVTNVNTNIGNFEFATKSPIVGMMDYKGIKIQLIEVPAIDSDYYNKGIVNNAEVILIFIKNLKDLDEIKDKINGAYGKRIVVFTKVDELNENEKRKIVSTLSSKRYDFVLISNYNKEGIEELKERLFKKFDKIRVYLKDQEKNGKLEEPIILDKDSNIKDVMKKFSKNLSSKGIKEIKLWGPSSKYPGQVVGLNHILKDLDVLEFKIKNYE